MLELKIPNVCSVEFDESKGWTYERVILFAQGFKRNLLSDYESPDGNWNEDYIRGYLFADKCKRFCELHGVKALCIKRAGIWSNHANPTTDSEIRGRPSRKTLIQTKFALYTRSRPQRRL